MFGIQFEKSKKGRTALLEDYWKLKRGETILKKIIGYDSKNQKSKQCILRFAHELYNLEVEIRLKNDQK